METPVIVPINDPVNTPLSSAYDAVAGSDVQSTDLAPDQRELLSEEWLDELASGLSEHGWMSLDVRSRLGENLLAALKQEVQILDRTDAMKKAGIGRGNDLVPQHPRLRCLNFSRRFARG